MTIALILDPYGEKRPSGLGRAALALSQATIAALPQARFIVVLKRPALEPLPLPGSNWEVRTTTGGAVWLDEAVRLSAEADVHVFFTPVYPLFARPRKAVVVVHDFAYLTFSNGWWRDALLRFVQRRALRRASRVVAVSEATRAEAAAFSGRSPADITVVYNGVNDFCAEAGALQAPAAGEYFLLGGGIKQRKNTIPAIEGFAAYVRMGGAAELRVLGEPQGEYGARVRECVRELGLESRVRFLGFRSDAELSGLYRGALAFVFPSAVEGFGMMPFEALSCGVPVVYADTPVLCEVLGEGGAPVDPHDAQAFAEVLRQVAEDADFRATLIAAGRERLGRYSWEKAGREFAAVLQHL